MGDAHWAMQLEDVMLDQGVPVTAVVATRYSETKSMFLEDSLYIVGNRTHAPIFSHVHHIFDVNAFDAFNN